MKNLDSRGLNFSDLYKGLIVYDRWYPEWGHGKIIKILKTRIKIYFERLQLTNLRTCEKGVLTYDLAHIKFLEKAQKSLQNLKKI